MNGGIYRIKNTIDGAVYIGSAKGFEYRFYVHIGALRKGVHINKHLQNAFNKYGETAFIFEVVEVLGAIHEYDKLKYFERENYFIDEARKTEKCYNVAKAEGGWTHSTIERLEEIGQNISKGLSKYYSTLTPEERSKKYGHRRNVPMSDEQKLFLSNHWKGKVKSEETKKRMSDAQKKMMQNDDHRKKLSKSAKEKRWNKQEEHDKASIYASKSMLKVWQNEEYANKMCESRRGRGWIYHDVYGVKRVKLEEIQLYLDKGYRRGRK